LALYKSCNNNNNNNNNNADNVYGAVMITWSLREVTRTITRFMYLLNYLLLYFEIGLTLSDL